MYQSIGRDKALAELFGSYAIAKRIRSWMAAHHAVVDKRRSSREAMAVTLDSSPTGAEFYLSKNGSLVYYDLSIVPPIAFDCHSYEACKEKTGSSGFNIGLQVRPDSSQTRVGLRRTKNCRAEICEHDGCASAYHFPTDHKKLHYCPSEIDFNLYFCT